MKQSDNTSLSYFKPFINYNNFLPNNKVAIRRQLEAGVVGSQYICVWA
jgi:hypothetical protein